MTEHETTRSRVKEVIERATRQTGLDDFGGDSPSERALTPLVISLLLPNGPNHE